MTVKRIIAYLLIFIIIIGMVTATASTVGSSGDPLITKSYIDSVYPDLVLNNPRDNLSNSMNSLKYKLGQTDNTTGKGVYIETALSGESISVSAGSSFIMLTGAAVLNSCSGTVIDVTDGTLIPTGTALSVNHRYVAAESTKAAATVSLDANIAIYGDVLVSDGASAFDDVPQNAWFYSDVCYAVKKGLVNGRSAVTFAPDDNLSVAEAIKLADCIYQLYQYGSITLTNDSSLWYKSYVDYALQNNIITKPYSNYTSMISRCDFVEIFFAAMPTSEYTPINGVAINAIPDVKMTDNDASQIYSFYRAGILTGSDSTGSFYPESNIKRSEVAAILTRMFDSSSRKSITIS